MDYTLQQKIDVFLKQPSDFTNPQGAHSTLYLLRRDVSLCFGFDPNNHNKIQYEALFPATMAVLAGIDLLAKFAYGDSSNGVGTRFRNFTSKYIDDLFQEELYQLRNSLLHSFGLYSETRNGKAYHFILTRGSGVLVQKISEKSYLVDIEILRQKFESSIDDYHRDLNSSTSLQDTFSPMFEKYGLIGIQ